MRMYVVALATGVLVGIIYAPARCPPPAVALVGLLGILMGEQVIPMAKRLPAGEPISVGWLKTECVPHVFRELPTNSTAAVADSEVRT